MMTSSEGICKYDIRGDTTLITFMDSARKHRYGYSDAQDYYQVALLNNNMVWFRRSKLINYLQEIGYTNAIVGNALQSIKKDNVAFLSFTNGFDMSGNLNSITYQTSASGSIPSINIITEKFKYRP